MKPILAMWDELVDNPLFWASSCLCNLNATLDSLALGHRFDAYVMAGLTIFSLVFAVVQYRRWGR